MISSKSWADNTDSGCGARAHIAPVELDRIPDVNRRVQGAKPKNQVMSAA
jgi:hypothetical protein